MSKITESARGKDCQLRLPGVCSFDPDRVVCCHIRIPGLCGVGKKPHDILSVRACYRCHMVMDGHVNLPGHITPEQLTEYVHEAHCRTLVQYIEEGLIKR